MHVRLVLFVGRRGACRARHCTNQRGSSRSDAVQAAIERGASGIGARADTAVANAGLISARARPNPSTWRSGRLASRCRTYRDSPPTFPIDSPLAAAEMRVRAA